MKNTKNLKGMKKAKKMQRGDIWMADLPAGEGDVLRDPHPVIVISSNRTNRRSRVVTVVPLTSSVKPRMPCHVNVSGFGLDRRSTALAEQLTTISKSCLLFRVGSLADSEKMAELEQAVKHQLEVA